jgi:type II secretory ATPase GspE/PulE/Tfp pilus assembly ATPase PilB-like protein
MDHHTVQDEGSIEFDEIEGETELTPPEVYAANLIEWASERHVSDVFISDDARSVTIAVRRLGRVEIVRRLAREYGSRLQGHFRVIAGAGAGDVIHPADGRGEVTASEGVTTDFRLSAIPTLFGQDVAIRLFDSKRGREGIYGLGLDDEELKSLKYLLNQPSGLILVSGPVASGKTCTLYSSLHYLNDTTRKIHTIEEPIEYPIRGVQQSQVNLRAKLDFGDLLTAVLRHSPDVIMIGEIRDQRIAETAVRAGSSGQLVLATVHADSAAQAINVMVQYGANPTFLARTLIGVVNQRLVRKLCGDCRQEIASGDDLILNQQVRNRLGDRRPTLYREVGCGACFDAGFSSLTCLPEIMTIDRDIEQAIIHGEAAGQIEQMANERGMLSLSDAAQARILRGETTPAESCRVLQSPELIQLSSIAREALHSD